MNELVQFGQNLILKLEEITEKISYERRVYESVYDRSPYLRLYLKNLWKK